MKPMQPVAPETLAIILAGGEGTRLYPLTEHRCKPAVPIGGRYRIVDFVLSNFVNSGFYKIKVLTQFKSNSLNQHLYRAWQLNPSMGHYVEAVPPQQRVGTHWFRGTADAVYQNLNLVFDEMPDHVCVFGGDHVYKMDVRQMLDWHLSCDADVTVATIPIPIEEASAFGIVSVDESRQVIGFEEKPENPSPMPGDPDHALVSMGNYIFRREVLTEELRKDALRDTSHDFGKTILPDLFRRSRLFAYDFSRNKHPKMTEEERGYWRDVGTIESYFQCSMDLLSVSPVFNLYNERWPIRTISTTYPAAKFVFADKEHDRVGMATDSLVSEGCILSGGRVNRSILSPNVRIESHSSIEESILFAGVRVGKNVRIRKAIIDKGIRIPDGTEIGFDASQDASMFHLSDDGIVIVQKGMRLEGDGESS